jgi:hypothetical protein
MTELEQDDRAVIDVTDPSNLYRHIDAAVAALVAAKANIYKYQGRLVSFRVEQDDATRVTKVRVKRYKSVTLLYELSKVAAFIKNGRPVDAPRQIVSAILADGYHPSFPTLFIDDNER